ncbi:hypothetical protein MCOR25_010390 [Pyricularia grisea]|nr:hypothetical protein MCOR25_010390 [Pyricularia grisea]
MASNRSDTRIVPIHQDRTPQRPTSGRDFHIAIFCALPLEADAVIALFDQHWDDDDPPYVTHAGDPNAYSVGVIGSHNVVLVHMAGMGKTEAAAAAAHCRASFPSIKLAVVVGVCGVMPYTADGEEIILGDVIISEGVVQYDLGRRLPEGFARKKSLQESLGRQSAEIRSQLAKLKGIQRREKLESKMMVYLGAIQCKVRLAAQYPGVQKDRLFESDYRHITDVKLCDDCGCNGPQVARNRLKQTEMQHPIIHIGLFASGDTVLKSGKDRDTLAKEEGVIAFEMEAAGVWEILPCIVIKSACDYADSHKMKAWQRYAAATAAACSKALLDLWPTSAPFSEPLPAPGPESVSERQAGLGHRTPQYHIPLLRNRKFTGRNNILDELQQRLFIDDDCQRLAIVGLGGVGKTQVALQLAYWVKENQPCFSIFWIPVISFTTFEEAYIEVGKKLQVPMDATKEDPKVSVQRYLSSEQAGKWFLIIDNADDSEMMFGSSNNSQSISQYLPDNEYGLIIFTTRSSEVGQSVAGSDVLMLSEMNKSEAMTMLERSLVRKELVQDSILATELLERLEWLPLAITQAAAYLNCNRQMSIRRYLELLGGTEPDMVALMSREFRDNTRYRESRNAVATTWLVSFDQIQRDDSAASDMLAFLSCIEPKAVPRFLLPNFESAETENAIGTLCGYAFLTVREDDQMYDMHSLVHLATKLWIANAVRTEEIALNALRHLRDVFGQFDCADRPLWQGLLSHALRLLDRSEEYQVEERFDLFYSVGWCLNEDRRFKEATRCLEESVCWRKETLPDTHPDLLKAEHDLANVYLNQRRMTDAIGLLKRVLAVRKQTLDERDPSRCSSEHELARAYLGNGQIEKAIEIYEHVVTIKKETRDEMDNSRLTSEHGLARAYLDAGRTKKAIEIFEHIVTIRRETLDQRDHNRLVSEYELARAYCEDGRIQQGTQLLEKIVAIRKETLDKADDERLASEQRLARLYLDDGQTLKAIKLLEHVVTVRRETLDQRDHSLLASEHELARAYCEDGRIRQGAQLFEKIVAIRKETLDKTNRSRLASELSLAVAYFKDDRIRQATQLIEDVLAITKEVFDIEDRQRLATEHWLAKAYFADGKIQEAIVLIDHLVNVYEGLLGIEDPVFLLAIDLQEKAHNMIDGPGVCDSPSKAVGEVPKERSDKFPGG